LNAAEPQAVRRPLPSPFFYPSLKDFNRFFDLLITDDDEARLAVFLTCLSAYTDEPLNLFLRGESSTGKTWITTNVADLFPPEDVWPLGGLSPKALIHEKATLVDEEGKEINLDEMPPKDDAEAYHEFMRRVMNATHVINLTKKILIFLEAPSRETFDMLRPILSHDKYEIEYRFVEKSPKGRLSTLRVIIRGWPATVFCTPRVEYLEELATRSFTVSPQISEEKIKNANMITAKLNSSLAFRQSLEDLAEPLKRYIRMLRDNDLKILNPFSELLAELYPSNMPRAMRDFKHLLGFVKALALLNFPRRPYIYGDKEILIATWRDVEVAFTLFSKIARQTFYGIPSTVLRFYELLESKNLGEFYSTDAETLWNSTYPNEKRGNSAIRKWLETLEQANLVSSEPDPSDRRRFLYRLIGQKKPEILGNSGNHIILSRFTPEAFQKWLQSNVRNEKLKTIHVSPVSPFTKTPMDIYYRIIGSREATRKRYIHSASHFSYLFGEQNEPDSAEIRPEL
jgi:hypothetical protein